MYRLLETRPLVAVFRYEIAAKRIDFWKHGPLLQFFDTRLPLNVSIFGNRTNQAVPSEIPVSYAKKLPSKTAENCTPASWVLKSSSKKIRLNTEADPVEVYDVNCYKGIKW